ncbi:MAG: ATP-binding response regulator [Oceanipulchritudo sp.]
MNGSVSAAPPYRFADKPERLPSREFYDILKVGDEYWLAGEQLSIVDGDGNTRILRDARTLALLYDPEARAVWFAGSGELGFIKNPSSPSVAVPIKEDFIWDLFLKNGKIWYFGSGGYGWVDALDIHNGNFTTLDFSPRPYVSDPGPDYPDILVGTSKGLYGVSESGCSRVLSFDATGGEYVVWALRVGSDVLLGTPDEIYRWTGLSGDSPVIVESNYNRFFRQGINNFVPYPVEMVITDFPYGLVFLDKGTLEVDSIARAESGLRIGDVYKVRDGGNGEVLVLGKEGIASLSMKEESRFFPDETVFEGKDYRGSILHGGSLFSIHEDLLVELNGDGFVKHRLPRTAYWIDADSSGAIVFGALNDFNRLSDGEVVSSDLGSPVHEIHWGHKFAYATATDGLYEIKENLRLGEIHESDSKLELLGEFRGDLFVLEAEDRILRFTPLAEGFAGTVLDVRPPPDFRSSAVGAEGIYLSTGSGLYLLDGDRLRRLPLEADWEVAALGAGAGKAYAALRNPANGEWAVSEYGAGRPVMLAVPHKDKLGDPLDLLCDGERLVLVGTDGAGWYPVGELQPVAVPEVSFDLLFQDKRVEDRTIPHGMHYIDLKVNTRGPDIPSIVQYRINEQRWTNFNPQYPSLPFTGHGSFTVELRAVHPNRNASPVEVVQFGIAPPWYMDPRYQVGLLLLAVALAILGTWGFNYLKSREIKRRNLWLESEVKKQTRELEAANAARTNFLAGLSHDIRNPLNGVLMIAETLARHPPSSAEDPRLKDLTEYGTMVDRMLGDILEFSAIDQKSLPLSFVATSVKDIITTSVKQNQFSIQREMVILKEAIDERLRDVVIRTDPNAMIKILGNLLINALEYSESEHIEIGASCIELSDTEVVIELYVADWGIGIDESEKELVFDRFYRGESGIESGKHGTGLGLSICLDMAHAIGCELVLEENEPAGCRFVLKGKFERAEDAAELDKEAVLASLEGKEILVVDDLHYNRQSVVEFFEAIGCKCEEADNGSQALEMLDAKRYHLALLDWDLPGLTGPEIARRHRKHAPDDPVLLIAVTAYTDDAKKRESEEAGMNGYISKPLTATRLAYCLANIQEWVPKRKRPPDLVDPDKVQGEIYKLIGDCVKFAEHYEWENLRRCAHHLTGMAMIRNNRDMQRVCRDLQVSASEQNMEEAQLGLLELQKWRKR